MTEETLISEECVAGCARAILTFLEENQIGVPSDLIPLHCRIRPPEEGMAATDANRGIEVFLAPSNGGTNAHDISFNDPPRGVPLAVKINPVLGYTKIMVKGNFEMGDGYIPFAQDPFGNVVYNKRIPATDIPTIISELERLAQQR